MKRFVIFLLALLWVPCYALDFTWPFDKVVEHDVSANPGQVLKISIPLMKGISLDAYDKVVLNVSNVSASSCFSVQLRAGQNYSYWVTLWPGSNMNLSVVIPNGTFDLHVIYCCFVGNRFGYALEVKYKVAERK